MAGNKVLIISNPEDEHTKKIFSRLIEIGSEPMLFFPEDLGNRIHFSTYFPLDADMPAQHLLFDEKKLDLSCIYSVWYRRPRLVALNRYNLTQEGLEFARDEWRAALEGMYALLRHRLWVSHPDVLREAARKPLQLVLAQQLGFIIPRTLISNNAVQARNFVERCEGKVVVKATGAGWVYTQNEKDISYVLTNRLTWEVLDHLDEIESAPVTFQEEVPKSYEIRANVVGQKVLSIKIDSQSSEISQVDWRRYDVNRTPYTLYELPSSIEIKCLKLTRILGLEFGAIDLIRRPDGEYVFLEINGNGQFLWAEELSGVAVSDALAYLLSGISPSLQSAKFE